MSVQKLHRALAQIYDDLQANRLTVDTHATKNDFLNHYLREKDQEQYIVALCGLPRPFSDECYWREDIVLERYVYDALKAHNPLVTIITDDYREITLPFDKICCDYTESEDEVYDNRYTFKDNILLDAYERLEASAKKCKTSLSATTHTIQSSAASSSPRSSASPSE